MKSSYKITLILVAIVCAVIIVVALGPGGETPSTDNPDTTGANDANDAGNTNDALAANNSSDDDTAPTPGVDETENESTDDSTTTPPVIDEPDVTEPDGDDLLAQIAEIENLVAGGDPDESVIKPIGGDQPGGSVGGADQLTLGGDVGSNEGGAAKGGSDDLLRLPESERARLAEGTFVNEPEKGGSYVPPIREVAEPEKGGPLTDDPAPPVVDPETTRREIDQPEEIDEPEDTGDDTSGTSDDTDDTILEHTVKEGEVLSTIAEEYYGAQHYFKAIAEANPSINPDRISPGMVLKIPSPRSVLDADRRRVRQTVRQANENADGSIHIVVSGDTLSTIASEHLGNAKYWELIHETNRSIIGNDPDKLKLGMKLKIPPKPSD